MKTMMDRKERLSDKSLFYLTTIVAVASLMSFAALAQGNRPMNGQGRGNMASPPRHGMNNNFQRPQMQRPPCFEELDADGDGELSLVETREMPGMTQERFNALDTSGNGSLSREELPPPPHHGNRPPQGRGQRGSGQDNGVGRPGRMGARPDMKNGRGPSGEGPRGQNHFGPPPPPNPEVVFDEIDTDNDGMISKEEFIKHHEERHLQGRPGGPSGYGPPQGHRPPQGYGPPPPQGQRQQSPRGGRR